MTLKLILLVMVALVSANAQYTMTKIAGVRLETGIPATSAVVVPQGGLAWDSQGRFYFAADNRVFRVNDKGIVDLTIGNGIAGFSGDGGPATSPTVELGNLLYSLATDSHDNLYISDQHNGRVRKVDAVSGTIDTVAGKGQSFSSPFGDGGPATSAGLIPGAITVDSSGNLYVIDVWYYGLTVEASRVRKVSAATGVITTVAGNDQTVFSGDGGLAINAGMQPSGIAVDSAGNLFIVDRSANRVRKVLASSGTINTVAGGGTGLDGGPALGALLANPIEVGLDGPENLYVSTFNGIRKIDKAGVISTIQSVAGTSFAVNRDGKTLDCCLASDGIIRQNDTLTKRITVVAGMANGVSADNQPAAGAAFMAPVDIAVDSEGNLYISDVAGRRVRKVTASTGLIKTVAGNGNSGSDGDGGPAVNAAISSLGFNMQIAIGPSDNLYIADNYGVIREVSAQTEIISTLANKSAQGPFDAVELFADSSGVYYTDGRSLSRADAITHSLSPVGQFLISGGFDRDVLGNFYVPQGQLINRVDSNGNNARTVAGNGLFTEAELGDGGPATAASLNSPHAVKFDRSGNLVIADTQNMRVRMVNAKTGIISTLAGSNIPGCAGGQFLSPTSLAVDPAGNIFVLDPICKQVYKISSSYAGYIDSATCQAVSGWAADKSRPGVSVNVSFYDGATLLATISANQPRSDVGALLGDSGAHGFSYPLPASVRNGNAPCLFTMRHPR